MRTKKLARRSKAQSEAVKTMRTFHADYFGFWEGVRARLEKRKRGASDTQQQDGGDHDEN